MELSNVMDPLEFARLFVDLDWKPAETVAGLMADECYGLSEGEAQRVYHQAVAEQEAAERRYEELLDEWARSSEHALDYRQEAPVLLLDGDTQREQLAVRRAFRGGVPAP